MVSYGPQVLFFLAIGLQLYDVTSWSFSQVPEPVVTTGDPESSGTFTVLCQADTPLVKCQFKEFPLYSVENRIIDLSRGSNSGLISIEDFSRFGSRLYLGTYNGTGLKHGQCGATFARINSLYFSRHFGCRGADEAGEWHEMDFSVVSSLAGSKLISSSINPRHAIVNPGSEVSILLKADARMESCAMDSKTYSLFEYFDDNEFETFSNHFRYYGSSPLQGECGLTLVNVTEEDNGPMIHSGWTTENKVVHGVSTLIVASPPTETYFKVDKLKYSVGDTLNATCSSLLSRPVANLTWTLDDRIIRQDGINDEFQEDVWSWPWDKKNITQRMSLNLEEEHFGKKLECKIQHLEMIENQTQLHYLITNITSITQNTV